MPGKNTADHLTGHELSRQAHEHFQHAHQRTEEAAVGHGVATFGHDDIAALAYELWQTRGCPNGSPEEDWFHAAEVLRSRTENGFEIREEKTDPSTNDQIKGKLHELKGKVREKAGQVTNDPNLEAEGQAEKVAGKVRKKVGQIEKVFEK
jgi:uncharacterized protein YjbJ (UPF0337 family)